jgi:hypothetical protein
MEREWRVASEERNPTRPSAFAEVFRNFAALPETGEGFRIALSYSSPGSRKSA